MTSDSADKIKLLLIDDDHFFSKVITTILQSETQVSYTVDNASTLESGLKLLNEKVFDMILLDLGLPDSDGVSTFDCLADISQNIPVVVLSGIEDEELALSVVKKGAQDYLMKSDVTEKMLLRILKYALQRHQQKKEVEELNGRLEKLSFLDPLTELLNRRGLQQVLARELDAFGREGSSLIAVLLDLDNFKPINDTFGHAVGDIVLQEVSKILKQTVRLTDYVSRIGGDEFLILLPNTRMAEAVHLAERLRLAINRNPIVSASGETIQTTASFGVAHVTKKRPSIDELLEETHTALAKSKQFGKNRISFGEPEEKKIGSVVDLLRTGQCFRSVKQPIWNLLEETPVAFEFLTRTNIPGFEMPDEFLNFSRENNILSAVDRRCLEVSLLASYQVAPTCDKHVNLLPSTIANFQDEQFNLLFPPQNLCGNYYIEISEQQILGDPFYLAPLVNEFRKRKIRVAIDDVGFGRSCLESLIVLRPDAIKIDKRLVRDVSEDPNKREMLRRLLTAINNLDATIIAEGIESRDDLETLVSLGVEYGQGYLWGKPS